MMVCMLSLDAARAPSNSATGTRTRVARVRAEYPDQLDYSGVVRLLRLASITAWMQPKTYMLFLTHRPSEFQLVAQHSRMVFTASSQATSTTTNGNTAGWCSVLQVRPPPPQPMANLPCCLELCDLCCHDSLAEWSKALASGASPQGRGFEPHSCHCTFNKFAPCLHLACSHALLP